jgi:hypothetical protein
LSRRKITQEPFQSIILWSLAADPAVEPTLELLAAGAVLAVIDLSLLRR